MPRGGNAHSGPAPDPDALRRNRPGDQAGWTSLPGAGYDGAQPGWPLTTQSPLWNRELQLWDDMWRKPQALMWTRNGQQLEVAMFCRNLAAAELPGAPVMLQTVVLRYLDSLGLSTQGMLRHRWRIVAPVDGSEAAQSAVAAPARPSARTRLTVVVPDAQ